MSRPIILFSALGAFLAASPAGAGTNLVALPHPPSVSAPATNDPVEAELERLMQKDDDAQTEVNGWISENDRFKAQGAGISNSELNQRIRKRFDVVRLGYEDLIKRYPTNADARVAYASFLGDLGDTDGQEAQLLKASELDPKDPAIWNNLGNYYGEFGPGTNAFVDYEKAIALNSNEPVYFENFATTVCMLRKDAKEHYHLDEQQVFDKSLKLYSKALQLDPGNFTLATELAETYYIIRPMRLEDALQAWTNALKVAHTEVEREGVYVHLARLKAGGGRFAEARAHLKDVTNSLYMDLKAVGERSINDKEKAFLETNRPPAQVK